MLALLVIAGLLLMIAAALLVVVRRQSVRREVERALAQQTIKSMFHAARPSATDVIEASVCEEQS